MPRYAAAMNGTGPYEIVLYTDRAGTTVYTSLYWQRVGSVGYSSYNGGATYQVSIGGAAVASGSFNFNGPAGGPIGEQLIGSWSRDVGAVGSALCEGWIWTDTSGAGAGYVNGYQSVATVPPAPTNNAGTPDQATSTGMRYQFSSAGDGGSGIIRWEYECWPSGGAPTGVGYSNGTTIRNDLLPGTVWNWHARGVNAVGTGPWSATVSRATLAANAAALNVAASLQGTSATLTPVADSTQPTVERWFVERRVAGTTTPVTALNFTGSSYVATGLTQGTVYEWRIQARSLSNGVYYTGPWSNWAATQQPNPNTNPGTYFDGSSAATGDATFSWGGTANNSISSANGRNVRGWALIQNDGLGVLYQQIGGRSGGFAARILCTADAVGANSLVFASNSENYSSIAEGGTYTASFYVQIPKRAQRMLAYIIWRNALNAQISIATGVAVVVGPNPGDWTRVMVTAVAPPGAVSADIQLRDETGTGFSPWHGGDYWIVDDAMISLAPYAYFDGNTPDDTSFTYEWTGTANASASTATPVVGLDADPLADPDCPAPPPAPRPPQISDACIDDITSWRRYWAIVPKELISKWIAQVPTITLTSGAQATRQARIRFWENPDELPPEMFSATDNWASEQVVTFIPATGIFTIDGVSQRARAQVGSSGSLPADHLLLGTNGTPVSWPLLRCNMGYLMSVDVPLDAPIGNLQVGVALTARM